MKSHMIFQAKKMFIRIFIALTVLCLSACSILSPVKVEPESTYMLNTLPAPTTIYRTHPITILVMPPEIRPAYNTTQMAYTIRPYQIAYFVQNRWAETPAQMMQPLLVQTLQNTHYFHAVATPPYLGHYDYVLNTQILRVQQDFTRRPAVLQFIIRAQLSRASTNQIIATKQFCVFEPIRQRTPYSGVVAANRASAKLLKQISHFCLEKIGQRNSF